MGPLRRSHSRPLNLFWWSNFLRDPSHPEPERAAVLGEVVSARGGTAEPLEGAGQGPSGEGTLYPENSGIPGGAGTRIRELPHEEFGRLQGVLPDYRGADPRTARIVVAETVEGEIVATWCLFATVHIEPLWVAEPHRGNPGLIRGLWRKVHEILEATRQRVSFAVFEEGSPALSLAERLGFEKIDGSLYWVRLESPEEYREKGAPNGDE